MLNMLIYFSIWMNLYLMLMIALSKGLSVAVGGALELFFIGFAIAVGIVILLLLAGLFQYFDKSKRF